MSIAKQRIEAALKRHDFYTRKTNLKEANLRLREIVTGLMDLIEERIPAKSAVTDDEVYHVLGEHPVDATAKLASLDRVLGEQRKKRAVSIDEPPAD